MTATQTWNTTELVDMLTEHFVSHPEEVPPSIGLDILAITNPDGAAAGSTRSMCSSPTARW